MEFQNEPVEDGALDASDDEKVAGIVQQTTHDVRTGVIDRSDVEHVLRQRLGDSGLEVSPEEFRRCVEATRAG